MVERGDLYIKQINALQNVEVADIAHGTRVNNRIIQHFVPVDAMYFLELGSSDGRRAAELRELGFHVFGYDINPKAIEVARKVFGLDFMRQADATRIDDDLMGFGAVVGRLELAQAVLFEGLLCNIVSSDGQAWKRVLKAADLLLSPLKFMMFADVFLVDEQTLSWVEEVKQERIEDRNLVLRWQRRYENNEAVGLPYGTFIVAKPGSLGKEYEWGTPQDLYKLLHSPDFERFALHIPMEDIKNYMAGLDYKLCVFGHEIWRSRSGAELLGGQMVFQKGLYYKYHPWRRGQTLFEEPSKPSPWSPDYWEVYIRNLLEAEPEILTYAPTLMEMMNKMAF